MIHTYGVCRHPFPPLDPLLKWNELGKCSWLEFINFCCIAGVQEYLHLLVDTVNEVRHTERFLCKCLVVLLLEAINLPQKCYHGMTQQAFLPQVVPRNFHEVFVLCQSSWDMVATWTLWSNSPPASSLIDNIAPLWEGIGFSSPDVGRLRFLKMRGGLEGETNLLGRLGLGFWVCVPGVRPDRRMGVSRYCALFRSVHSPLVEQSRSLHWGIGGWWVVERLVWTSRQRRLPPGWLIGPSVGGNTIPFSPYMPRTVPQRWVVETQLFDVALRRHWGIFSFLCGLVFSWWGVGYCSLTIGRIRFTRICPCKAIAGQKWSMVILPQQCGGRPRRRHNRLQCWPTSWRSLWRYFSSCY